ncbi:MAG: Lin0368 family putative glycerol transporter subunit [Bacillota bacterium]
MRYFGSFIGGGIAGMFVFGIWPEMWQTYGVFGGWVSGFIIISIMWFLNHYIGAIYNKPDAAAVDMACGIAMAGTTWLIVKNGLSIVPAIPTIVLCMIGGALGGWAAGALTKAINKPATVSSSHDRAVSR